MTSGTCDTQQKEDSILEQSKLRFMEIGDIWIYDKNGYNRGIFLITDIRVRNNQVFYDLVNLGTNQLYTDYCLGDGISDQHPIWEVLT